MATTTPNFGWDIPQSTDLVKDGATAIAALGTDIDTAFVDLKGGTTGQVLTKASNTDLDYSWTSVDPLTILDAKGDLISATAADTPARLAVGTNGQYLKANSSTSTGLEWGDVAAGSLTLLSTTSLSGATTTISGISGSYTHLELHIYGVTNATADGQFRIAPNGTTNITTNRAFTINTNGGTTGGIQEQITYLLLAMSSGDPSLLRTSSANYWVLRINNYAQTSYDKTYSVNGLGLGTTSVKWTSGGFGRIDTTSAITSLVFSNSGGNLSTGTVLTYGVK